MTRFKSVIIALLAAIALVAPADASSPYRGQKSMGLFGGYTTRNESADAGIFFQYRFAKSFRIAPSAGYDFRNRGEDAFTINLDFHMPFALNQEETVNFYPLAGVGYSVFSRKESESLLREAATDNRHRTDRFGTNLGGGIEYFASSTLRLAFEAQWRWRTDYSTGLFNVSIGYRF